LRNHLQYRRHDTTNRCAICDGKFGLVRHYSWRTALCSRKCVDHFKSREECDRRWLLRLHSMQQTIAVPIKGFRNKEAVQ
jgi:hypothetical protein